ncbi:MAG: MBL fold metallo-hydrolase [Bacteroidetes bacterium]|nr:MBL fold metallo-hydrolase [Bacteroidota bacterium]
MSKVFGKLPTGKRLERIKANTNYKVGAFQNQSVTSVMAEGHSFGKILKDYYRKPKTTEPSLPIPSIKTNLKELNGLSPTIVWFGHSSYLLNINGKNILVDPVFSGSASPFSFMVKGYKGTDVFKETDFPDLDVILLTHDHYDHLDYNSILKLKSITKKFCVSLGVASHLEYWGIDKNIITEFEWWQSAEIFPGMMLTAAPARHFSGRGIRRGKTLWSSFILKTSDHNLYLGGDSGYDTHFKEIGQKYGPFDIAILESGQYNPGWKNIHMMPEETVQASIDLNANVLLPVHWGKFTLSLHPWNEPIQRLIKKAGELNVKVTTPLIGQEVILGKSYPAEVWWNF